MKLAARMGRVGESATLKVGRLAAELRAQGRDVLDLGVGEPDFNSPAVAIEAARKALAQGFTKYTDGNGLKDLRQALAARLASRYGAPWSGGPDGLITVGAKMALYHLALALLDDGDEVVLPSPCWVSFPEQIRLTGATPVLVPTSGDDGFAIHAEPILAALSDRTRAVLVNSPSNPTGGIMAAEDLRRVVEACAERGILFIADETYDRFVYGDGFASSAALAASFPETVVLVGSFSKTYAMTGWRLGYCFGPPALIKALGTLQSHSTSNPTSFAMKGAIEALAAAEPDVEAMIAEYTVRRDLITAGLSRIPGFRCAPPHGAFYVFPNVAGCYRPGRQGSVELSEFLLQEAGVAVVPGIAFGDDDHVRISFACSRQDLETALSRIASALAS